MTDCEGMARELEGKQGTTFQLPEDITHPELLISL